MCQRVSQNLTLRSQDKKLCQGAEITLLNSPQNIKSHRRSGQVTEPYYMKFHICEKACARAAS